MYNFLHAMCRVTEMASFATFGVPHNLETETGCLIHFIPGEKGISQVLLASPPCSDARTEPTSLRCSFSTMEREIYAPA